MSFIYYVVRKWGLFTFILDISFPSIIVFIRVIVFTIGLGSIVVLTTRTSGLVLAQALQSARRSLFQLALQASGHRAHAPAPQRQWILAIG